MLELSHQLAEVTCKVLRKRRQILSLSQDTLAQRTGLARTYISDVERGARHPTLHNLTVMADALEWSTSDLVRQTEIEVTKLLDPERVLLAQRHQTELTALEEQILHYITKRMSDGVLITSTSGQFVVWNQRAKDLTGLEPPTTDPAEWTDLYGCFREDRVTPFHTEELPLVRAMHGVDSDNTPMFLRNPLLRDGRYIEITARTIKTSGSETPKGAVIVFGEISHR
jgi:transcriptional regulator with XRE-family HTH domain